MEEDWKKAATSLAAGRVGVFPTDTLYGMVGSALIPTAVERIYRIRSRDLDKPMIVLIGKKSDLSLLGVVVSAWQDQFLGKYWPGPVSVILPCPGEDREYLHRGTRTLAIRLPANERLRNLLQKSGPIVAPSANPQGLPPAKTVEEAKAYFGRNMDFYVDGGHKYGQPSTLVDLYGEAPKVLRGAL